MRIRLIGCWVGLLMCGGLSGADDKKADDKKTDEKAIQGTWVLVEQSKPAEPVILCEKIVFKDDKMTFHYKFQGQQSTTECTFKLDPTADPKTIDFTPTGGASKGMKYLGLYEFQKGQLRFTYRGPGSTRPKDFEDKFDRASNGVSIYYVFEPEPKK